VPIVAQPHEIADTTPVPTVKELRAEFRRLRDLLDADPPPDVLDVLIPVRRLFLEATRCGIVPKGTAPEHSLTLDGYRRRLDELSERLSSQPDEPTPHDDGPEPPYWFWWEGKRTNWKAQQRPWSLLNFMWTRESAEADDVLDAVWGETKNIITLRTAANRANTALPRDHRRRLAVRQVEPARFVVVWEDAAD
jgi:hypothetical protein